MKFKVTKLVWRTYGEGHGTESVPFENQVLSLSELKALVKRGNYISNFIDQETGDMRWFESPKHYSEDSYLQSFLEVDLV